ncbi:MAG: DeoR/GlpR transcriptional regulator [Ruminococcaceae bacterium]|nr:DeoR/GlpR transcriptional regulator [Oscillospiraceae bacterium]
MFIEERHEKILETIRKKGKITIGEITASFGISDESARRDLRMLEQRGLCKRTHGGAIIPGQVGMRPPADREFESMPVFDTYREIARAGAKKIQAGDTVYLTGGSLGYLMLEYLPRNFPYTLVINSVDLGKMLRGFDNVEVYLAGGKMRQSGSLVDSMATEFVSRLHFDLCLITGAGLTAEFGLSNGTGETAAFQQAVIRNSRRKCLLMPGVKVGTDAFVKVCDADAFDEVITDWECVEEHILRLEEKGLHVTVAEEVK